MAAGLETELLIVDFERDHRFGWELRAKS